MADNLANLRNYKIQLKQVETALINEPDNEDLKTLQKDLSEVIKLTKELMSKEEIAALESLETDQPMHNFSAGDWVLAPLSEDGQFYEAQVEDITSDGQCTVVFNHSKKRLSEVCLVGLLKPLGKKRSFNNKPNNANSLGYQNKNLMYNNNSSSLKESISSATITKQPTSINQFKKQQELRDAQRRKQQKRKDKFKQLEDEREKDKMKWQSFSTKVQTKKMKGKFSKKSIFASPDPDSQNGRVGVGTCGVGGRPMTEYQQQRLDTVPRKPSSNLPKLSLNQP